MQIAGNPLSSLDKSYQLNELNLIIFPSRGEYIGLVGLLGVSLQLTPPSVCSVRYLRRLFTNNPENCETPSPCQTLSSCLCATCAILHRRLKASFS